jgi:hypothetical protein
VRDHRTGLRLSRRGGKPDAASTAVAVAMKRLVPAMRPIMIPTGRHPASTGPPTRCGTPT